MLGGLPAGVTNAEEIVALLCVSCCIAMRLKESPLRDIGEVLLYSGFRLEGMYVSGHSKC